MNADTPAERRDTLAELLRQEHSNVPVGAWGFFFPVTLAAWRFVNLVAEDTLGEVAAAWLDTSAPVPTEIEVVGDRYMLRHKQESDLDPESGPLFFGPGGDRLLRELQEGELLDAVEAMAFSILRSLPPRVKDRGVADVSDVPTPPADLLDRLSDELCSRFRTTEASGL
jgi:hypothetical protein